MTAYFFDSSALLKRYVTEVGSAWVRQITGPDSQNRIIISQITAVEVVSGVSRRKRENVISDRTARAIRLTLERHIAREYYDVAGFTAIVSQQAIRLLEQYPLRAYDAVQLASALVLNQQSMSVGLPPLIFVSADVRLLNVAAAAGLSTLNPATA